MRDSIDRHQAKILIKEYFVEQGYSSKQAEAVSIEGLDRDWDPIVKEYQAPILSIYGGKDKIVVAERNMERNKAVLVNKKSEVKLFPNMNHMFQPADKGGKEYYWEIETTFDESVVDYIDKWLQDISM